MSKAIARAALHSTISHPEPQPENGLPPNIPDIIRSWLAANAVTATALADMLQITRFFLSDILAGRRELPDDRIAKLPQGLRGTVAEARARRYEAMAWLVRHSAEQADKRSSR